MKIVDFFKNLLNSLLGSTIERINIINSMNQAFKEYYYTGEIERLCKASVSTGNSNYAHEMSVAFFRSGFKISIENDSNLRDSEIREISQYILSNKPFIRQLMALGFDTLIIMGKTTNKAMQYCLKEQTNLSQFTLS